jgi:2'-5' RNA ligase
MLWYSQLIYGATIAFLLELFSNGTVNVVAPSSDNNITTIPASEDPYKSSRFVGHSLWMIPAGTARKAYDEIIGTTARQLDTFHFLPHITLVAAILTPVEDVVQRTRHLATLLAPYEFELDDLSQRDAYFQCVYATMKLTDAPLHANAVARQVFPEKQSDPPYMPHLSLIYGAFGQERKTQEILPRLREKFLERAPDTLHLPVDAIELWSTQGDVKDWYLVERVPLTGPPAPSDNST